MRVGMILDSDFPPDPRIENEAGALIAAGHEVYLFCLDYTNNTYSEEVIYGINVRRFPCNKWVYKLSALAYTIPLYHWIVSKWIKTFINDNAIETIHIHDIQIATAVFRLKIAQGLPKVLDLHENRPEIMKFYVHLQKLPGKLLISPSKWAKAESKYIKESDKCVVVTQEAADYYVDKLGESPNKFIVVPNTVREKFLQAPIDQAIVDRYKSDKVILYVGDTGLRRGLLTAIDAMPSIIEKHKDAKLVVVGKNSTDDVLKNRVSELGVTDYVDFQGWQNFKLFPSYIESSMVCISPLHRNIHHDTTYANKIFQYMAYAKPQVLSDCPAQANVIIKANCGLIHEAENVDSYTTQMITLLDQESLRTEMGNNGRKFVKEEYSFDKASAELISYYSNNV